jgi:hypothetical protein
LLKEVFLLEPDTGGFLIQGQIFPNPLSYGFNAGRWKETRPIDALMGFQHGDLNIGNILGKFAEDSERLEGYFLIDFALYKSPDAAPLRPVLSGDVLSDPRAGPGISPEMGLSGHRVFNPRHPEPKGRTGRAGRGVRGHRCGEKVLRAFCP